MNILMVSTNRVRKPMAAIPYGACMVTEALARKGHNVRLLDLMFETDPDRALVSAVERCFPDVVGISVRNIDNNDMQDTVEYYRDVSRIVDIIRRKTSVPIVLGGSAVGVMPEALLRYSGADFAVLRDGETVFPRMMEALSNGGTCFDTPDVAWMENNVFHVNGGRFSALDSEFIVPDFRRLLDIAAYRSAMATIPIQSKRGCPFDCVYCTYGISEGRRCRLYPPDRVADAVGRLADDGFRDIEFVDSVFNAPYDHAMAVCEQLAQKRCGARLLTMEINPGFLDGPLLEAMERAGFIGIGVTAESADDTVLENLGKGYDASHVYRAAEAIRGSRLPCIWIFMFGGPGETRDSVCRTLHFARTALRSADVVFFNVGIRIYPGTELERIARRQGQLRAKGPDMLTPVFYLSPEIERDWLRETLRQTARKHFNMLDTEALAHPWLPAINRLASRLPLTRPLWKHTAVIRKMIRLLGRDIGTTPKNTEKTYG